MNLNDPKIQIKIAQTIVSGALYFCSLWLPCIIFDPQSAGYLSKLLGCFILLIGWLGIFFFEFAWLANFPLFLAFVFAWTGKPRQSATAATIALVLGLDSFLCRVHNFGIGVPGIGFYFWIGSILVWISNYWVAEPTTNNSAN